MTTNTYADTILAQLQGLAEEEYRAFTLKITPTKQKVLGVRIPALRKIAKAIAKENPYEFIAANQAMYDASCATGVAQNVSQAGQATSKVAPAVYDARDIATAAHKASRKAAQNPNQAIYEMVMLEGMVLSYINKPFVELLPLTEAFLDKVDNWAQIDSTVADYKQIKQDKPAVLQVVKKWLTSDKEFVVRAGLVILLGNFIDEPYLPTIFKLSEEVTHTGYYVHMGNAWLISMCMAKFPEETLQFFKKNRLDDKTHNKAIQKSRESFRVSKEHKELLKTLKR